MSGQAEACSDVFSEKKLWTLNATMSASPHDSKRKMYIEMNRSMLNLGPRMACQSAQSMVSSLNI